MDSDDDAMSVNSTSDIDMSDQDSSVDFDADSDNGIEDGYDMVVKDVKSVVHASEVEFSVISPQGIQTQQQHQIRDVSSIIGQPPEATAILLRHLKWNKERLIEQYMDKHDELLDTAGLGTGTQSPCAIKVVPGFTCDICCQDDDDLATFALKCNHRYCVDCFRHYLTQKIKDEGEAARIKCPGEQCQRIVDTNSINLLLTPEVLSRYGPARRVGLRTGRCTELTRTRYQELLIRTYVDDKDNLKWCPAPNCVYAIECGVKARELDRVVPAVQCQCTHRFCFGCTLSDHRPTPCALTKKWLKKCADDSETANWISVNTKECPKCHSTIEKNGGCNHMTCRKCRHEFCWMCMGIWSEHGNNWYNCNRFEEKSGLDGRDAQAKSRQSLERYLHYYNRYANHEASAKLDKDIYLKTERKMVQLQSSSNMSWIEVQFLEQASQALQLCRQTLKWTYAFAYYLARNNLTHLFEDNQRDLELAVENLSEMFEKPTDQLAGLKVDILDKVSYCSKRRTILLDDTAENLRSGKWKYNVELQ